MTELSYFADSAVLEKSLINVTYILELDLLQYLFQFLAQTGHFESLVVC